MVAYVFILIGILAVLIYIILNQPPQRSAALLVKSGAVPLIVIGTLLTLMKRGVIGLPLIFIGFAWLRSTRMSRPMTPPGGRKSTVSSSDLEMELDHDTGELDGQILRGRLRGARLSELGEDELLSLYQEIKSDPESSALLESYLDRYHPGWTDRAQSFSSEWNGSNGSGEMSKQEAYQVLGVAPGSSREEILEAWRRLIKRVHPDRGGSAFLTTKINTAKSVLLGDE